MSFIFGIHLRSSGFNDRTVSRFFFNGKTYALVKRHQNFRNFSVRPLDSHIHSRSGWKLTDRNVDIQRLIQVYLGGRQLVVRRFQTYDETVSR